MEPVQFFKCLADETRLSALLLITLKESLCVCDLTDALDLSQPKVSRHLAALRKCGVLIDERRGKWVFYRLHPELPEWAISVLHTTAKDNTSFLQAYLSVLDANRVDAKYCD